MAAESDDILRWWQWLVSAAGGALLTLVAFRTNMALMNRRIDDRKKEIEAAEKRAVERIEHLEEHLEARLKAIDRKQTVMLQMLVDIARKAGVDNRITDALVTLLSNAEESVSPRPSRGD